MDDTEGHGRSRARVTPEQADDTEGHGRSRARVTPEQADDTEGHGRQALRTAATAEGDDDSAEGHSMLSNPLLARELASAREQEIQRDLRNRRPLIGAGERPNRRKR